MTTVPRTPPELTDGAVTLRGHRRADLPDVARQAADPEMRRWTRVPIPYTPRDAEDYLLTLDDDWRHGRAWAFAVEAGGRYAGSIDVRPREPGSAEVGFGLGPWARGHGVMSRAVRLAAGWAFGPAGLLALHWRAQVGNWPSRRVAWATGFRVEGTVRGLIRHRDELADAWVGSLRRGDPMRPATPWLDPPLLTGPGVLLRPHRDVDVARMVEMCADPVTQHWLEVPSPYTERDAVEHLLRVRTGHAEGRALYWAVAGAAEGADVMAGEVAVFVRDDQRRHGEIGYLAHPGARGRGLTTAAVRLVARHALLPADVGGLGLDRVLIRAAAGNAPSRGVAERAGFRRSGVDRHASALRDGTLDDDVRYDLLPGELPPATDARP